jgi:hypothetical protein
MYGGRIMMLTKKCLHPIVNRSITATIVCCALVCARPAFSQQTRADQAVELLRLAIQCPTAPQQELSEGKPSEREVVGWITSDSEYLGDRETLRIQTIQTKRHHDRTANRIFVITEKILITAKYSDLVEVSAEATLFWRMLFASCRDKVPCVSVRRGTSSSSESQSAPTLAFDFCEDDTLQRAKIAVQELITFNSQKQRI